jgi:hypothetical protein
MLNKSMSTSQVPKLLFCCLAMQLAATSSSSAWSYNLTNGNSSVTIHADADYGMSDWTVDGQEQLYKQWFWYRKGATSKENTINQLNLIDVQQSSPSTLSTLYERSGSFNIEVSYSLLGGTAGSGFSTVGEQIKIANISGNPLDFHFFQYVDFDLGGSHLGDTVQLGQNISGLYDYAYQNKGTAYFADEIVSPGAQHGEVGLSQSIYGKLVDDAPTTLNDSSGPVTGDATWAFQWDMVIPVGGVFSIALNKSVFVTPIPEPSTLALGALAFALFGGVRHRFRQRK